MCAYLGMCVAVRGHLVGVIFLLPSCVSWGLNSGLQAWWKKPLPSKPGQSKTPSPVMGWRMLKVAKWSFNDPSKKA